MNNSNNDEEDSQESPRGDNTVGGETEGRKILINLPQVTSFKTYIIFLKNSFAGTEI